MATATDKPKPKGRPKKDPNAPVVPRPRIDYDTLDTTITRLMRGGKRDIREVHAAVKAAMPHITPQFLRTRVKVLSDAGVAGVVPFDRVKPAAPNVAALNALDAAVQIPDGAEDGAEANAARELAAHGASA